MTGKNAQRLTLSITNTALLAIQDIETYSVEQWGKKVADRYIDDLQTALVNIQDNPQILKPEPDFHKSLSFYRFNKHLLVFDLTQEKTILLLTVLHGSRDIPSRLSELEPTFAAEVELLTKRLRSS